MPTLPLKVLLPAVKLFAALRNATLAERRPSASVPDEMFAALSEVRFEPLPEKAVALTGPVKVEPPSAKKLILRFELFVPAPTMSRESGVKTW